MIRLPGLDEALIGSLLDAGAAGLILPTVDGPAAAEALVAAAHLPPRGRRSHGPNRAALPTSRDAPPPVLLAMVETAQGLAAAAATVAVDGIDGLFVGPGDLGLSLGLGPGQDRDEPEILRALADVRAIAHAAGKRCAVHAVTAGYARRMAGDGYDLVTAWADVPAVTATLDAAGRLLDDPPAGP